MMRLKGLLAAILLGTFTATQPTTCAGQLVLKDFETDTKGWKYVAGEEFPGAAGSFTRDLTMPHKGKSSARLQADFTGGGAYVGAWLDLSAMTAGNITELRLWIKSENVASFGVRLNDSTGQCHQKKNISLAGTGTWQEVVLKIGDIVGSEHWGGANDGKWHAPATGFGLNIGKSDLAKGTVGTIWLDDVSASAVTPGKPTLLACSLSQPSCRPAYGITIKYRWNAEPMGKNYKAFVHISSQDNKKMFQDDHDLPGGTAAWSGPVEYETTVIVPTDAPEGDYAIKLGLYDPKGGGRQEIKAREGVIDLGENAFQIGTLKISADAPLPKLGPPTLNLDGYKVTFDEDFNEKELSVSEWGPGTKWIAHTPYAGDFGDASFADPTAKFPFSIENGILRIEARKTNGKWQAGLLSSVDKAGNGFSQQYGYFEMKARFPKGPGTWPAFWLLGVPALKDRKRFTNAEIDVVEQYGVNPNALHTTLHLWYPDGKHTADGRPFIIGGMTDDFHRYGVMISPDFMTFYFDGIELRKIRTPEEARVPMYLLVDLALGGGWPIDKTPDPSYLYVDYIRAYSKFKDH